MIDNLYNSLSIFEDELYIFRFLGFGLMPERRFEKNLKNLYDSMLDKIKNSREILERDKGKNSYGILRELEILYRNSKSVFGCRIININKAVKLFDELYATIPEDIKFLEEKRN